MNLVIKNISENTIILSSLALEIEPQEEISLDSYDLSDIKTSPELELSSNLNIIEIYVNNILSTYNELKENITYITKGYHETMPSIRHNENKSYITIQKNENNDTQSISYYADSLKTSKIKEEEFIRNIDNQIIQINTRFYENNIIIQEESEVIVRNEFGKVESIV